MATSEMITSFYNQLYWLIPVGVGVFVYITYSRRKYRARFEEIHAMPYVTMPNTITMVVKRIDIEPLKKEAIEKNGKVFAFNFMFTDSILVADPELLQIILSKEFTSFVNRHPVLPSDPIFKHVIALVMDDKWKRLRSVITPAFSTGKIRNMMPRFRRTLKTLVDNIEDLIVTADGQEPIVDMKKVANAFTMNTISQTAFGLELDSLKDPNNDMVRFGQMIFTQPSLLNAIKFATIFSLPRISNLLKLELNHDVNTFFSTLTNKLLEEQRKSMRSKGDSFRPSCFIEFLLEAEAEYEKQLSNEDPNQKASKFITNEEIVAQCVMFFIAGFESTATTVSLTLHHLAMHPDIQDKVYQEIMETLPTLEDDTSLDENANHDPIERVNLDNLAKFKYLSCVVDETLRLHTPGLFTERVANKDLTLQTSERTYNIKKDDLIHIPIHAMHRDPEQFPEPEEFQPERFLNPVHHNYAYLPFSHGPRNCVAKTFALLEVKLALLNLLYHFKFSQCKDTKDPPAIVPQINMIVIKAVPLKVEHRN